MARRSIGFALAAIVLLLVGAVVVALRSRRSSPAASPSDEARRATSNRESVDADALVEPVQLVEARVVEPSEEHGEVAPPSEAEAKRAFDRKWAERMQEIDRIGTEKGWDVEYKNASVLRLEQDLGDCDAWIHEQVEDEIERRFADGEYEILPEGTEYSSDDFDPLSVYYVRFPPNGPAQRVTVPKREFREAYELKAMSAWLRRQLAQRAH